MANNYQQWSEMLHFNKDGDIKAQKAWVEEVLSCELDDDAEGTKKKLESLGVMVPYEDQAEYWPNFEWSIQDVGIWVCSPEAGGIDEVCHLVQGFLKLFNPMGSWSLTWAETCSKMRVGEFAGGAVFVTANTIDFHSDTEWLNQKRKEHEKVLAHARELKKIGTSYGVRVSSRRKTKEA